MAVVVVLVAVEDHKVGASEVECTIQFYEEYDLVLIVDLHEQFETDSSFKQLKKLLADEANTIAERYQLSGTPIYLSEPK